ncbi:MAG: biotin synthase BioB [Dehalococcoidia bacterium]|jgi:biotin synthase
MNNALNPESVLRLYHDDGSRLLELSAAARDKYSRRDVELCAIINAKSGRCSEDCVFCAQSAHHKTAVAVSPPPEADEVLAYAKKMEGYGVKHFSLVTSGRGISDGDLEKLLPVYRLLKEKTELGLCASLGIITPQQARRLKESGVTRYHHNLETGESYFPNICTTHRYQDRLDTVAVARGVGLEICCGGLVGLGEAAADRVELAFALKELGVRSIPLNILMPVAGTPLEDNPTLNAAEMLKTMALLRCVNPQARLRFAAGRPLYDSAAQLKSLEQSCDGLMVGDYLTKKGLGIEADIATLAENGFRLLK